MRSKAQAKRLTERLHEIREEADQLARDADDGDAVHEAANLAIEAVQKALELAEGDKES